MNNNWLNKSISFEGLYIVLASFLFFSGLVVNSLNNFGHDDFASLLNKILLYSSSVLAVVIVIKNHTKLSYLFPVVLLLLLAAIYQFVFLKTSMTSQFMVPFLIHSLGGFFIGISIGKVNSFIKCLSFFSLVFGLVFITEPINHFLMGLSNMSTGYTLTPIVLLLLVGYFVNHHKVFLILSIILGLEVILFTSRGCGLSIILCFIIFIILKNREKKKTPLHTFFTIVVLIILLLSALIIAESIIVRNEVLLYSNSAFISRLIYGGAFESSGRDLIWGSALGLIKDNLFFGVGVGVDRVLLSNVPQYMYSHNIVLEILLNYGLVLGLVFIVSYVAFICKATLLIKSNTYLFLVFAFVCAYLVRLIFSGSYLDSSFEVLFIIGLSASLISKRESACFSNVKCIKKNLYL